MKGMDIASVLAGIGKAKHAPSAVVAVAEPMVTDEEGAAAFDEFEAAKDSVEKWKKFVALCQLAERCEPQEMADEEEAD